MRITKNLINNSYDQFWIENIIKNIINNILTFNKNLIKKGNRLTLHFKSSNFTNFPKE